MRYVYFRSGLLRREWRWHLKAGNNRIVATSGEGYRNKADCLHAIELVRGGNDVPVLERRRYALS